MHFLVIFIFFLIAQVNGKDPLKCDKEYKKCYRFPNIILNILFTELATDDFCRNFKLIGSCIYNVSRDCTDADKTEALSTDEAAKYICKDERKMRLKSFHNCLTNENITANLSNCRSQVESWFANVNPNLMGKTCKPNDGQYSCHENAPKTCNSETHILLIYNNSKWELNGCDLDFTNLKTKAYSRCNILIMTKCLFQTMNSYATTGNILDLNFFKAKKVQFNEDCIWIDRSLECVINLAECELNNSFVQQSISQYMAIDYFCKNDRDGYNKFAKCLARKKSMFDSCGKLEPNDCSSYNSIHKCLVDSSIKNCGNSSAIDTYLFKTFHPMLKEKGCSPKNSSYSNTNASHSNTNASYSNKNASHSNTNAAEDRTFHNKFFFCIIAVLKYFI